MSAGGSTNCQQCLARDKRIAGLEQALQEIVAMDARSMYERCPDCWTDDCGVEKTCKQVPHSRIGKLAKKALEREG